MRTPSLGESRLSSTSGVLPMACTMSPYLPPHGLLSRRPTKASESVALSRVRLERPPVPHLESARRELAPLRGAVAAEPERLVEGVCPVVLVERPQRDLVVALLREELEAALDQRAAHPVAPVVWMHVQPAHLGSPRRGVGIAVGAEAHPAGELVALAER